MGPILLLVLSFALLQLVSLIRKYIAIAMKKSRHFYSHFRNMVSLILCFFLAINIRTEQAIIELKSKNNSLGQNCMKTVRYYEKKNACFHNEV